MKYEGLAFIGMCLAISYCFVLMPHELRGGVLKTLNDIQAENYHTKKEILEGINEMNERLGLLMELKLRETVYEEGEDETQTKERARQEQSIQIF